MIQAILFDFYGTLARFHPPREELQATACADFGISVSPEGIARGYALADGYMAREVAHLPLRKRDPQAVRDFFAEYERRVLQGAGVEVSPEQAARVFTRLRQIPYGFALYDDVLPTLDMLKLQGLTLGLLSNIEQDMEEVCQGLGLSPYLDFVVTSQEVDSQKPHPPIFLAALEKAGVEPQEALHVGDQYEADVKGARAVGIYPVLLDRDGLNVEIQDCPRIESLMELVQGELETF